MDAGIAPPPSRDAGFTLIELMIVVTVLSILTVSVGLSMSFGRVERRVSDDAQRLQRYVTKLQENAIYSRRPRGLMLSARGWRVAQFNPQTRVWDTEGYGQDWQGAASVRLGYRSFGVARLPDVVFLPDGRSTPFEITLSYGGSFSTCKNDGWTGLICDP